MKKKYIIIQGNLYTNFNGTSVCTGLTSIEFEGTQEECKALVSKIFDEETNLIYVLNCETMKRDETI